MNQRVKGQRATEFTKLGRNTNISDCILQSINSNKHRLVLDVLYLNGLLDWLDSWTRSSGRPTCAHIAPGAHCQRRLKTTEDHMLISPLHKVRCK